MTSHAATGSLAVFLARFVPLIFAFVPITIAVRPVTAVGRKDI